eukprot:1621692-Rhodomonas_salina.1
MLLLGVLLLPTFSFLDPASACVAHRCLGPANAYVRLALARAGLPALHLTPAPSMPGSCSRYEMWLENQFLNSGQHDILGSEQHARALPGSGGEDVSVDGMEQRTSRGAKNAAELESELQTVVPPCKTQLLTRRRPVQILDL